MKKEHEKEYIIFGKNLAFQRKKRNISQQKFAEMLNMTREHIAKVETAKRASSFDFMFTVMKTFGITPAELFVEECSVKISR